MDKRKVKINFQANTDFLDDFLPKGSLCVAASTDTILSWSSYVLMCPC